MRVLDVVVLTRDLPEERLVAGDIGTIVAVHGDGAGYTVEFMTLLGDTIAVPTLPAAIVRMPAPSEVRSARELA